MLILSCPYFKNGLKVYFGLCVGGTSVYNNIYCLVIVFILVISFFKLEYPWSNLKKGLVSIAQNIFQLIWYCLFSFRI